MTARIPEKPATQAEYYAVKWLEACEAAGRKARYLQHAAMTLRHWIAWCVHQKCDPLHPHHEQIYKFVERRHSYTGYKGSHTERRRQRAVFRAWFRWLHESGYTESNHADGLRPKPRAQPRLRVSRHPFATESNFTATDDL